MIASSSRRRWPAAVGRLAPSLLALLVAGCDDAKVAACFGDQDFCERIITANLPPEADAGADQEVTAGDPVSLDGSGSADPDGRIASHSWTQTSGSAVALVDASRTIARFDAPDVDESETLTFRLTVVDDDGAASADDVSVVVVPVLESAIRSGLDLLTQSVAPEPVLVPETCTRSLPVTGPAWFAHAGLWLTAHAMALEGDADPNDITRFLDAARVLLARSGQRSPSDATHKSLWDQGVGALARFALDRDPALAEAAAGARPATADGTLPYRLRRGEITLALAHGKLVIVALDPYRAADGAVTFLRKVGCDSGLDPIRLAAATVFLLEQARGTQWRAHGDGAH